MFNQIKQKLTVITTLPSRRPYLLMAFLLLLLVLMLLVSVTSCHRSASSKQASPAEFSFTSQSSPDTTNQEQDTKKTEDIVVDVKGAVKKEGVYQLAKGSRLTDAIALAGGLTEDVDRNAVNFAIKLTDESVVYIARKSDHKAPVTVSQPQEAAQGPSSRASKQAININQATLADLTQIPGVGEKRAQEILTVREQLGGFNKLEDLKKVSGIGPKMIEKLKDEITID
ncbi:ComEA family DNA-binding protein [Streptococcus halichoeri]|uniref:ComEA family DNA-binding protein n=1 Tax=Streptococcus halichoeri TaxID=254785 RepID=UPI0013572CE7|nr:ComEA family DNA-binding protein [Streptococcus halichoeri]